MTNGTTWKTLRGMLAGSLLLGTGLIAAPASLAQDDDDRFSAWVYSGTVEAIDDAEPIEEIGELEMDDDDDDRERIWAVIGNGQEMPDELYTEEDDEDEMILDDLLNEPHLLVIHEGDDTSTPIVAVGVIEGEIDENGGVLIQLDESEGSGFEGRAWIGPDMDDDDDDDDDNDDLEVYVGVYPAGAVEPLGTPEATAVS